MKDLQVNGFGVAGHVRGDVFKMGVDGRHATYRLLFATEGSRSQVLLGLSVFSKRTQKTPPVEIALALRRLADWRG